MLSIRNGWQVTSESASDVRRIWPPPSPSRPSIVIMSWGQPRENLENANQIIPSLSGGSILSPFAVRSHFHQLGIELAENSDKVALSCHDFADVFINHRDFV